jgi:hypothetical protein
MQPLRAMDIKKSQIQRFLRGVLTALPAAMPIVIKRKRTSVLPFILGGIGFAIAGGAVAMMFLSPRTRQRALVAAKDTYGKVNQKVGELTHKQSVPNGVAGPHAMIDAKEYGTTSGM